jgi:hypothetical protein
LLIYIEPLAIMHKHAALFLSLIGLACSGQGAEVDVQLRLLAPDALEVGYTLPPSCRSLAFLKAGDDGRTMRAAWQPQDGTGVAGADRLERREGTAGAELRFRVPAATRQVGYPAAFPMGQGLYAHLSNYAVDDSCGKVRYRVAAPGIAANGRAYRDAAVVEDGADTAVLLLAAPLAAQGSEPPMVFDPRLSAATVARIKEIADGTVDYLRGALPDARYTRPIVAAAYAEEPGGPNIGGDAAGVLRLTLFNWPREPGPAEEARLTRLVSHEFSHRFQLRDAVDVYPDARLIHEGGGEFLRWMASLQNGWLTPAQAAAELDQALGDCVLYTDGRAWRTISPREIGSNRLEYSCGLPVYVYVLAARQGEDMALGRINGFYRELGAGRQPDLARALECGSAPACQARWLAPLLGAETPMETQWIKLLDQSGLAAPTPPTQAQRDAMVLRAMVKLMKDDCRGASGTTQTPDGVIFDGMKRCKTFTRDAWVTSIEGLPVFGDAATGEAMLAACTARHVVVLGLKEGGTLEAPCAEPYRMRSAFYRADIGKVLAALRRGR